jgi:rhodanese-related sulfurtransferase
MHNKLIVINVLSYDSYADCHIKSSIHVPFDKLNDFAQTLDKNQPIVVYCASYVCSASRKAWELLNSMGFKNAWAYEGGMAEWFGMGLPAQGVCKADYVSQKHQPPNQTGHIRVISAQDLQAMMRQAGLI